MKACIGIPYEEGEIFPHFGEQKEIKLYSIEDGRVASSEILNMGDIPREEIGVWLVRKGVNALLCSEIHPTVYGSLMAAGIPALAGISGNADEAIGKLLSGALANAVAPAGGCGGCSGCSSCGSCGSCGEAGCYQNHQ